MRNAVDGPRRDDDTGRGDSEPDSVTDAVTHSEPDSVTDSRGVRERHRRGGGGRGVRRGSGERDARLLLLGDVSVPVRRRHVRRGVQPGYLR